MKERGMDREREGEKGGRRKRESVSEWERERAQTYGILHISFTRITKPRYSRKGWNIRLSFIDPIILWYSIATCGSGWLLEKNIGGLPSCTDRPQESHVTISLSWLKRETKIWNEHYETYVVSKHTVHIAIDSSSDTITTSANSNNNNINNNCS